MIILKCRRVVISLKFCRKYWLTVISQSRDSRRNFRKWKWKWKAALLWTRTPDSKTPRTWWRAAIRTRWTLCSAWWILCAIAILSTNCKFWSLIKSHVGKEERAALCDKCLHKVLKVCGVCFCVHTKNLYEGMPNQELLKNFVLSNISIYVITCVLPLLEAHFECVYPGTNFWTSGQLQSITIRITGSRFTAMFSV